MSEAAETLVQQLREWEAKAEAARETLRIADTILPTLREALSQLDEGVVTPSSSDKSTSELQAEESRQNQEDLVRLRNADEVQKIAKEALPGVSQRFEQGEMDEALEIMGYKVNRSTLRQNLLMLAKAEDGIRVHSPGKGRKATVFEKVSAPRE